MKNKIQFINGIKAMVISLAITLGFSNAVIAQGLNSSCGKELQTYCSQVTPGEGRIMACLYAYGDKISEECVDEIEGVTLKIGAAVDSIQHGYEECSEDIEKFCPKIEPGQGRMYKCIKKSEAMLGQSCKSALGLLETQYKAETK